MGAPCAAMATRALKRQERSAHALPGCSPAAAACGHLTGMRRLPARGCQRWGFATAAALLGPHAGPQCCFCLCRAAGEPCCRWWRRRARGCVFCWTCLRIRRRPPRRCPACCWAGRRVRWAGAAGCDQAPAAPAALVSRPLPLSHLCARVLWLQGTSNLCCPSPARRLLCSGGGQAPRGAGGGGGTRLPCAPPAVPAGGRRPGGARACRAGGRRRAAGAPGRLHAGLNHVGCARWLVRDDRRSAGRERGLLTVLAPPPPPAAPLRSAGLRGCCGALPSGTCSSPRCSRCAAGAWGGSLHAGVSQAACGGRVGGWPCTASQYSPVRLLRCGRPASQLGPRLKPATRSHPHPPASLHPRARRRRSARRCLQVMCRCGAAMCALRLGSAPPAAHSRARCAPRLAGLHAGAAAAAAAAAAAVDFARPAALSHHRAPFLDDRPGLRRRRRCRPTWPASSPPPWPIPRRRWRALRGAIPPRAWLWATCWAVSAREEGCGGRDGGRRLQASRVLGPSAAPPHPMTHLCFSTRPLRSGGGHGLRGGAAAGGGETPRRHRAAGRCRRPGGGRARRARLPALARGAVLRPEPHALQGAGGRRLPPPPAGPRWAGS